KPPIRLSPDERMTSQRIVLDLIRKGISINHAAKTAGVSQQTVYRWKRDDTNFRNQLILAIQAAEPIKPEVGRHGLPPFDIFRRRYLKQPLFPLHYNLWDVIEGRRPRYLDNAMTYEPHERTRVIMNIPPNHGKTTCFSIDYPVWLIHQ